MAGYCLIHGAWHDGSCWNQVAAGLEARGHRVAAPDLPFDDPAAGYEARIRAALSALDDLGEPAVVVGHSMGANYAPLVAARRPGALLVYLCPAPQSAVSGGPQVMREGFPFPNRRPDGTNGWEPEQAIAVMYPRLPEPTARELAARLLPMAPAGDAYPLDAPPENDAAFVIATHDEFFDPDAERTVAQLLGLEPIDLATGHFPMVEDPEALVELLDGLGRGRGA